MPGRRHTQRCVFAWCAALRTTHRHNASGGGAFADCRVRRNAATHPRRRAAKAEYATQHVGREADDHRQRSENRPEALKHLVQGDLDWIVMKALEKDRNRRYESPGGLARDVSKFLKNEPIEARPPTMGYRTAKYLRRNRVAVAVAGLLILSLTIGLVGTTWQAGVAKKSAGGSQRSKAFGRRAPQGCGVGASQVSRRVVSTGSRGGHEQRPRI